MKTILLLSSSPAFPETISSGLDVVAFKVIHRVNAGQAEPLLQADIVDICLLDLEADQLQSTWSIEQLRRIAPHCPIIAFIAQSDSQGEEEAYVHGVSYVLTKPVRPRILATVMERLLQPALGGNARGGGSLGGSPANIAAPAAVVAAPQRPTSALQALSVVRDEEDGCTLRVWIPGVGRRE